MGWFLDWWQSIGLTGQIMACMAIPTSIVLLLQAILMLIGSGFGGESDSDFDSDGIDADGADGGFDGIDADGTDGGLEHGGAEIVSAAAKGHAGSASGSLKIFTVRGIIAFFAIGGWAGIAAITAGIPAIWSVQIALLAGVAAMILASVVIRFALRMQSSGNIDLRNAIDQIAEVYITIPPARSNTGKVMMLLQERYTEIDAVTDCEEAVKPYTKVVITGLVNRDCLIVSPINTVCESQEES